MYLKRAFLLLLPFILTLAVMAGNASLANAQINGMRVMPTDEMATRADAIVRGVVKKVEKANYLGTYTQLATLQVTDILKGDSRMREVKIWAGSQVINANDYFNKNIEVVVFIVREQTFFRLLNYQYGQFLVEAETIKGWREPKGPVIEPPPGGSDGTPGTSAVTVQENITDYSLIDKNYGEVRRDIESFLIHSLKPNETGKR